MNPDDDASSNKTKAYGKNDPPKRVKDDAGFSIGRRRLVGIRPGFKGPSNGLSERFKRARVRLARACLSYPAQTQ
ncbi:MAG: hypothetical protein AAF711_00450 [Planctomycetota bacterium]